MKMMKKVTQLIVVICLMVSCFSMVALAANGKIMFEDPSTATGEILKLKGVIEADDTIGDRSVVMSYDTEYLRFKDGDNVTETADGQLTYQVTGSTAGTRVEFFMNFDVLKEGTTDVLTVSYDVKTASSEAVTCQEGSSKITIAEGTTPVEPEEPEEPSVTTEPGTGTEVEINGVTYTFTDAFATTDIPEGFVEGVLEYDAVEHKIVENTTMGVKLGYMLDAEGVGEFYMYNEEDATFVPFKQITISDTTTIVVLSETEGVVLPSSYQQTTALVNGVSYPAWQDTSQPNYCILHALNNRGEKSLYQFDTVEQTYQRYNTVQAQSPTDEDAKTDGLAGLVTEYFDYVLIGAGALAIIFLLLIIILSVKLYNRNAELDELYDEYGIDLDDEPNTAKEEEDMMFIDVQSVLKDKKDAEIEEAVEAAEEIILPDPVELIAEPDDKIEEEKDLVQETLDIPDTEDDIILDLEVVEEESKPNDATSSVKEELHEIAAAISDGKSDSFWGDDLSDFEMDFIDLDD